MPELIPLRKVREAAKVLRQARLSGDPRVEALHRECLDIVWKYTVQCGCACPCGEAQGLEKIQYHDGAEKVTHMLCEGCRDGMTPCDSCGDRVRGEMMECQDRSYCASCYEENTGECQQCGCRFPTDSLTDGIACEECVDDSFCRCSRCNRLMHDDDVLYPTVSGDDEDEEDDYEDHDTPLCEACHSRSTRDDGRYRGVITRYGWVPSTGWVRRGDKKDPITLGVELEVHCKGGRGELIRSVFEEVKDWVIASLDGSLDSEKGVEFRSHPATLEYSKEWWGKVLATIKGKCISHDAERAHGLHVHVGVAVLTELAQAKLAYFMHSPDSRPYLRALARREGCSFSKFVDEKGTGRVKTKDFKNGDRYEVLNWTSKTVEFRLFRGTTKPSTFFSCVEFTHALVRYVLEDRDINKVGVKDFVEWVQGEDRYPNLACYDAAGNHEG